MKENNPEYFKDYYLKNKDKFKKYEDTKKEQKIECSICKCMLVKRNMKKHMTTPKHLKKLEIKKDSEKELNTTIIKLMDKILISENTILSLQDDILELKKNTKYNI